MIEIDPIHKLIGIPVLVIPDPDIQMQEIGNMIERSRIAQSFLRGEISFDDYLCFLAEQKFDPVEFCNVWNAGGTFL